MQRSVVGGGSAWVQLTDAVSGKPYYWHRLTDLTTFHPPPPPHGTTTPEPMDILAPTTTTGTTTASTPLSSSEVVWQESVEPESRRIYYWNRATGTTTWDKPTASGAGPAVAVRIVPGPDSHCVDKERAGGGAAGAVADPNAKAPAEDPKVFPYGMGGIETLELL